MARSTNNQSIITPVTSLIKLLPYDSALVEPPCKPRAIRRRRTAAAETRKQRIWLAYGGKEQIADIKVDYSDKDAEVLIAQLLAKSKYAIDEDHSERHRLKLAHVNRARKLEANLAIGEACDDWVDGYDPYKGRRTSKPRKLRKDTARLAWTEYPGRLSKAQIRAIPKPCKDQFCGCRGGNNPLAAAVTR